MMDLAANDKDVHADFYNGKLLRKKSYTKISGMILIKFSDFGDLFDDEDDS